MTDRMVRAYVIGQTPRPDLEIDLRRRFPSGRFAIVGALDGMRAAEIPASAADDYPLETRLHDGTRVVVGVDFVAARLQRALDASPGGAVAHLILCAGPFPDLTLPEQPAEVEGTLIRPFEAAVDALRRGGFGRLEVLVPFTAQAGPAAEKWEAAGFTVRTHVLGDCPPDEAMPPWLAKRVEHGDADALVFDYVGFPSEQLSDVAARVQVPVFDLGRAALDVLEETLAAP